MSLRVTHLVHAALGASGAPSASTPLQGRPLHLPDAVPRRSTVGSKTPPVRSLSAATAQGSTRPRVAGGKGKVNTPAARYGSVQSVPCSSGGNTRSKLRRPRNERYSSIASRTAVALSTSARKAVFSWEGRLCGIPARSRAFTSARSVYFFARGAMKSLAALNCSTSIVRNSQGSKSCTSVSTPTGKDWPPTPTLNQRIRELGGKRYLLRFSLDNPLFLKAFQVVQNLESPPREKLGQEVHMNGAVLFQQSDD